MARQQTTSRSRWTEADIPDLSGRTALITGANAGLGLRTARVLAGRGAHVIIACRNLEKADRVAHEIETEVGTSPDGDAGSSAATPTSPSATSTSAATSVSTVRLDLTSQASVRDASAEIHDRFPRLDLLINNAGVMDIPLRRTEDGFEATLATNHLGPFSLTGLVLDRLAADARIVTVSSVAHLQGVIDFDDLQANEAYDRAKAYAQSKLANLLFTYELDRRLRAGGSGMKALACHPGIVRTELFANASRTEQLLLNPAMRMINFWAVQDVRMGALPALRAATDPAAQSGEYYGPRSYGLRSWFYTGYPAVVESNARSHDEAVQTLLWTASEELTGVSYADLG